MDATDTSSPRSVGWQTAEAGGNDVHPPHSALGLTLPGSRIILNATMIRDTTELLRAHGIQPTAQRVAVAEFVLHTDAHPSADKVFAEVKERVPVLSRATVYNTLNLLVDKGLLRQLVLAPGNVVFDPKTESHHHFVDEET